MNPDHDRDRVLDQALKQALDRGAGATVDCLDAEALAAWMDGGLDARSVAMAEAHASHCARCQAMIRTVAHTIPTVAASGAVPAARWWRWWLAPLAASAAAMTVWIVAPPTPPPGPVVAPAAEVAPASPADARAGRQSAEMAKDTAAPPPARESLNRNRSAGTPKSNEPTRKAEAPQPAAAPAESAARPEARARDDQASAAAAAAPQASQLRMQALTQEILSPDPSHRWRLVAAEAIEYSADGGQTWTRSLTPAATAITAGSSPAPTVCWVIGRAGVVLLTRDARTFARVPFPEAVDLAGVDAADARTATVTTADGRTFRTDDSGLTWRRP